MTLSASHYLRSTALWSLVQSALRLRVADCGHEARAEALRETERLEGMEDKTE